MFIFNFYTKYKKIEEIGKILKKKKSSLNIFKNYMSHGKNVRNMNSCINANWYTGTRKKKKLEKQIKEETKKKSIYIYILKSITWYVLKNMIWCIKFRSYYFIP